MGERSPRLGTRIIYTGVGVGGGGGGGGGGIRRHPFFSRPARLSVEFNACKYGCRIDMSRIAQKVSSVQKFIRYSLPHEMPLVSVRFKRNRWA